MKKVKPTFLRLSALLLLLATVLTLGACGGESLPPNETESNGESQTVTVTDVESNTETSLESVTVDDGTYRERILVVTDVHNNHDSTRQWYRIPNDERMARFVEDVNDEYRRDPFSMILFLGDISLDHWAGGSKGCWINSGVSYSKKFIDEWKPLLPDVPMFFLPGNHEQFSEERWNSFVGNGRKGYVVVEDYLMILWDAYSGDIEPSKHLTATYTPMDVAWVRSVMDAHPDKRVILLSHHFDETKELEASEAAAEGVETSADLVSDERVVFLFAGHKHTSAVKTLGDAFDGKKLIFCGNYSYYNEDKVVDGEMIAIPGEHMWGFRELILTESRASTNYIVPENTVFINGVETRYRYTMQNGVIVHFD